MIYELTEPQKRFLILMSSNSRYRKFWLDENELHIVLTVIEAEKYNDLAKSKLNDIMSKYKSTIAAGKSLGIPIQSKYIISV